MHKAANYTTIETTILYSQEPLILKPEWVYPRNSTPCKGPESILLGSAFYPRRSRLGVCVSFILKQRWVCTEWKGKRPPRSPKEKSGGIRETSHKVSHSVGPSWVFAFDFSSSVFVLKV